MQISTVQTRGSIDRTYPADLRLFEVALFLSRHEVEGAPKHAVNCWQHMLLHKNDWLFVCGGISQGVNIDRTKNFIFKSSDLGDELNDSFFHRYDISYVNKAW